MKKILSFVLVLAMIASMMCISVSAAGTEQDDVTNKSHFVGTYGDHKDDQNESVNDGVPNTFTSADRTAEVIANLSAAVVNRYAVEINYTVSDITIDGTADWNVNTLVYDNNLTYKTEFVTAVDNEQKPTTSLTGDVKVGEFTVTNYSDMGVDVTLSATASVANAGITCKIDDGAADDTVSSEKPIIGAYVEGDDEENRENSIGYEVELTAADWARAFTQLKNYNANSGSITIASVTISVAPAAIVNANTPAQP